MQPRSERFHVGFFARPTIEEGLHSLLLRDGQQRINLRGRKICACNVFPAEIGSDSLHVNAETPIAGCC